MVKKRNRYSEAFRAEAVRRIVEEDLQIPKLAKSLNLDESLLYRWVRNAAAKKTPLVDAPVQRETVEEELKRLRRENAQLRMEKEILRKVAAFFAKESENE